MNAQPAARLICLLMILSGSIAMAESLDITINRQEPTVRLSPHLYGLFFEDINYGADGGLYAELVQNRSFEYYPVEGREPLRREFQPLYAWDKVERDGARCELAVTDASPLNANNTKYLEITIDPPGAAGVRNLGFDGIRLDQGARYDVSLYARITDWQGAARVDVALELPDGTRCGSTTFKGLNGQWRKFEGEITSDQTSDVGRLVITTPGQGTLALDMVSLFPQDTWKERKNGLRKDLVQALQDLNPKFLRFPGGCIAHGHGLDNVYHWKDTIGDVAQRKPNWNLWGYHQTYGLGFYEYFLLCEDLDMQPLPVMPLGVSCGFRGPQECIPMEEMGACVQDVLDLIEFATGPASSQWGAIRAQMGHPEPFAMEFICLGNEPHDNRLFRDRFPLFVKAIRAKYPQLKIIGTSGLGWQIPIYDLMTEQDVFSSDEHYYENPNWFLANTHRFDNFDRSKPKIFVGEYASQGSTLFNAIAEAAYLTGIERNADIVDMTCYAPLFGNVNHLQWNPDLIYFDKRTVVRSANYYVQQLFAQNKGDVYLTNSVERVGDTPPATLSGAVGIGTWRTAIEVEDLRVNGRALDPTDWRVSSGDFHMNEGRYSQRDAGVEGAMSMSTETFDEDHVTYTLRAKKLSGNEGFLVGFGGKNTDDYYWWNIGGWNNTAHAIQRISTSGDSQLTRVPGRIESNRWYDLKVELSPGRVQCYLDNELVHDLRLSPPTISISSTLDQQAGEIIVKLVNPTETTFDTRIHLNGVQQVEPEATLQLLTGERGATNTVLYPDRVQTKTRRIKAAKEFTITVPKMSVQVLRIKAH